MAFKVLERVRESWTGTGSGSVTLGGAVTGWRSFSGAGYANGDTCPYVIANQANGEFEAGIGTWTTGGVLTRTAGGVYAGSSGSGTLVVFSAGTKDVFVDFGEPHLVYLDDQNAFDLPAVATVPTAPAAGFVKLFAQNRAGRVLPRIVGPSGIDVTLQPSLFGNNIVLWLPSSGSLAATSFGSLWTVHVVGTGAAKTTPAPASTNAYTSMKRAEFATGTTATGAGGEQSDFMFWRGNAAGLGGFFFFARFGVGAFSGTWRLLIGLSALNGALTGDPSAVANTCGLSIDAADTVYQLLTRDATTASKTSTGHAPSATEVLDFVMFAPPNGSSITMRLSDAVSGTVYADNVVKSTNLPVNTAFMAMHAEIMSATGTTSKVLGLERMYCEADL